MTWLIRQHRTYEQVYYQYESEFTSIVKTQLAKFLPTFSIVNFAPLVTGDAGVRRKPDLALIDRNYAMWAVVEVELESHPLEHHVVPQVQAFVTGRYGESHADLIYEKDPRLNLESLRNLIAYVPPEVLVVVNSRSVLKYGWSVLESDHSAHLTFIESFRSEDDDVVFALSGYIPAPQPSEIISLKKHMMLNALVCAQPMNVPAEIPDEIRLYWLDRPYSWRVLRTMDTVVFLPPGGITVREDRNYEVRQIGEGEFHLREL